VFPNFLLGKTRENFDYLQVLKFLFRYFSEMLQNDDEFSLMEKMGVTVVRLGYMWTGFNPEPNTFNYTYVVQFLCCYVFKNMLRI
jgi:hypothetical protein